MNFLAHALFVDGPNDVLVGSVAGDFIQRSHRGLTPGIRDGIRLHRHLDTTFDGQPGLAECRKDMYEVVRHYQNAVLDITCDHILASRWGRIFGHDLPEYAQDIYRALEPHMDLFSEGGQSMAQRMIDEDWLVRYESKEGLEEAIIRLSRRVRKGDLLRIGSHRIMDLVPRVEEPLLRTLPILKTDMEDYMHSLGYQSKGRVQWRKDFKSRTVEGR